jgi:hypothetical protein
MLREYYCFVHGSTVTFHLLCNEQFHQQVGEMKQEYADTNFSLQHAGVAYIFRTVENRRTYIYITMFNFSLIGYSTMLSTLSTLRMVGRTGEDLEPKGREVIHVLSHLSAGTKENNEKRHLSRCRRQDSKRTFIKYKS